MLDDATTHAVRQSVGLLVEEANADAVVICLTRQRAGLTETIVRPFGNIHAVRGIVNYAYEQLCEGYDTSDEQDEEPEEDGLTDE
jgi:hypothetical protein|tara:strand:- start:421 stop:675 length:255 start_codon:yes stop_codon:yes gene_type:complete